MLAHSARLAVHGGPGGVVKVGPMTGATLVQIATHPGGIARRLVRYAAAIALVCAALAGVGGGPAESQGIGSSQTAANPCQYIACPNFDNLEASWSGAFKSTYPTSESTQYPRGIPGDTATVEIKWSASVMVTKSQFEQGLGGMLSEPRVYWTYNELDGSFTYILNEKKVDCTAKLSELPGYQNSTNDEAEVYWHRDTDTYEVYVSTPFNFLALTTGLARSDPCEAFAYWPEPTGATATTFNKTFEQDESVPAGATTSFDRPLVAWDDPTEDATDWVSSDLTISTRTKSCTCECTAPTSGQPASEAGREQRTGQVTSLGGSTGGPRAALNDAEAQVFSAVPDGLLPQQSPPPANPNCPWKVVIFARTSSADGSLGQWRYLAQTDNPGSLQIVPGQRMALAAAFFPKSVKSPKFGAGTTGEVSWTGISKPDQATGQCGSPPCAVAGYAPAIDGPRISDLDDLTTASVANSMLYPIYFLNASGTPTIEVNGTAPGTDCPCNATFKADFSGLSSTFTLDPCPVGIVHPGTSYAAQLPENFQSPPAIFVGFNQGCPRTPPDGMSYKGSVSGFPSGCLAMVQKVWAQQATSLRRIRIVATTFSTPTKLDLSKPYTYWYYGPSLGVNNHPLTLDDSPDLQLTDPAPAPGAGQVFTHTYWRGYVGALDSILLWRFGPCDASSNYGMNPNHAGIWVTLEQARWQFGGVAQCTASGTWKLTNAWQPTVDMTDFYGEPMWSHSYRGVGQGTKGSAVNKSGCV